jgi:predicted secreted protein with PEFG-CTERM motif
MIFLLFGILITSIGISPVFGENGSVVVSTDKSSYVEGDTITISGTIKNMVPQDQLTIIIQSPNGNLVALDQLTVGVDNQFSSTEITAGGKLMKTEGSYTIKVQYREQSATASFQFDKVTSVSVNELDVIVEDVIVEDVIVEDVIVEDVIVEDVIVEDVIVEDVIVEESIITETTITIQDSTDLISYEIKNGKVINVIPDMDAVSLLVYIESSDDGSITLTIPRSVLDATVNNGEGEFFVLVDGEEVDFEEIITLTDRTLTINFSAGTEEIEIIGTFVIPEFGTIAAMILAVAIISIIAISSKSRLSIVPRY